MKNILAIDPGPTESAVLLWDGTGLKYAEQMTNPELIRWIRCNWPSDYIMAVEMVACYGMPVGAETFETCLIIGRLQEIWSQKQNKFALMYRKEIKLHLCGNLRAKDSNIRQALIDRFGAVGTKKNPGPLFGVSKHLWSALAIAVTYQETKLR